MQLFNRSNQLHRVSYYQSKYCTPIDRQQPRISWTFQRVSLTRMSTTLTPAQIEFICGQLQSVSNLIVPGATVSIVKIEVVFICQCPAHLNPSPHTPVDHPEAVGIPLDNCRFTSL